MSQSVGVTGQFTRFVLAGILNSLLGYAVIFGAMYLLRMSPESSNLLGYSIGLSASFLLNRFFTFRSNAPVGPQLVRFLLVFGIAYLANLGVLLALLKLGIVDKFIAQILAGGVYVVTSYALNKMFVFQVRRGE